MAISTRKQREILQKDGNIRSTIRLIARKFRTIYNLSGQKRFNSGNYRFTVKIVMGYYLFSIYCKQLKPRRFRNPQRVYRKLLEIRDAGDVFCFDFYGTEVFSDFKAISEALDSILCDIEKARSEYQVYIKSLTTQIGGKGNEKRGIQRNDQGAGCSRC